MFTIDEIETLQGKRKHTVRNGLIRAAVYTVVTITAVNCVATLAERAIDSRKN